MQILDFYDFEETVYAHNEMIIGLFHLITYKSLKDNFINSTYNLNKITTFIYLESMYILWKEKEN